MYVEYILTIYHLPFTKFVWRATHPLGKTVLHTCPDKTALVQELKPGPNLAGPALFHGRLRAFRKCTNGVAFSKGRPNLPIVRLTL